MLAAAASVLLSVSYSLLNTITPVQEGNKEARGRQVGTSRARMTTLFGSGDVSMWTSRPEEVGQDSNYLLRDFVVP